MRKIINMFMFISLSVIIFLSALHIPVAAQEPDTPPTPQIHLNATAAILVEQSTGRVLFGYNEHERRYPASMTKMLTALIVLDHFEPDEIIIVGPEINNMPAGYATMAHTEGEAMTIRMLLKALMIRSGNETGRVLAINVIRRTTGNANISYEDAKRQFSTLMNERAQELGVLDSHFNNPYGLHSPHHYTTAYDLALIAIAYMQVPLLAEIASMLTFTGDGTEGQPVYGATIRDFDWVNPNQTLPDAHFGHPHITGIKTGFTTPAGECLAGAATFGDISLITIVFDSESPGRWHDTRRLMDYGFFSYSFREVSREGQHIENVRISNPRRGYHDILGVVAAESYTALLSHAEYTNMTRVITYNSLLLPGRRAAAADDEEGEYENEYELDDGLTVLIAPIEEGDVIGHVSYWIGEEMLFRSPIIAASTVMHQSFDSDMDYIIAQFTENIFTLRALPYWLAIFGTVFGVVGVSWALSLRRKVKEHDRWHNPKPRR